MIIVIIMTLIIIIRMILIMIMTMILLLMIISMILILITTATMTQRMSREQTVSIVNNKQTTQSTYIYQRTNEGHKGRRGGAPELL